MLPTPLTLIPTMVLDGLFLFMAITALDGNQMFERALLLITEQVNMLSTLKLFPLRPAILNIQLLSQFFGELSTLGVQECVAEYRHKMVLCSHLEYLICNHVHSYSISPCQTPFWNTILATLVQSSGFSQNKQKWSAHRDQVPTLCSRTRSQLYILEHWHHAQIQRWVHEKKGVFTLLPSDYCAQAPSVNAA